MMAGMSCTTKATTVVKTLGAPIPSTPHAVSVCLPKWQDNVDYEEGRERVHGQLRSGYPRFVYHASVKRVFAICERASAGPGEKAIVFASRKVAEHCRLFVLDQAQDATADVAVKVVTHRFTDDVVLHAVVFPAQVAVTAKRFWQHSGEVISSRLAEFAVREGRPLDEEEEIDRYVEEHYGRNLSWNSANAARNALRRRISDVSGEKKTNVYLYATGMAAIYNAHRILRLWRPEGHVVLFGFAYLDTLKVLQKFGKNQVIFHPLGSAQDLDNLKEQLRTIKVVGLFCEFPSNPLLRSCDMRALSSLANEYDFPIFVDDTLAHFHNINILPYCDVLMTSLTKVFSGDSNVMAGSVVLKESGRFYSVLKPLMDKEYEELLWSEDAIFLERNSRSFMERSKRINATAEYLADMLVAHPKVGQVYYPKYITTAEYNAVKRSADSGYGGLMSIVLKHKEAGVQLFDALDICKGPSLGTNFTLSCPYTIIAHYDELDWAESCGVSRYLVRVSIGLEDPEELWAVFSRALDQCH